VREEYFEELSNGQFIKKKVTTCTALCGRGRCLYSVIVPVQATITFADKHYDMLINSVTSEILQGNNQIITSCSVNKIKAIISTSILNLLTHLLTHSMQCLA
jgi:heme oxygenase